MTDLNNVKNGVADKTYPYDENLPFVLVNRQTGEMMGRAVRKATAENFAGGLTVDVIDTTPAPRVPEDAEWITWTGGGLRYTAFRNVLDTWNYAPAKSALLEDLPGVTPDTVFTVLDAREERKG